MSVSKYNNKFRELKKLLLSNGRQIPTNPSIFNDIFINKPRNSYTNKYYKNDIIYNHNISNSIHTNKIRNSYKSFKNNLLAESNTIGRYSKSVKNRILNLYEKYNLIPNQNLCDNLYCTNRTIMNFNKFSNFDKTNRSNFQFNKNDNFYLNDIRKMNNYIFCMPNKDKKIDNQTINTPVNFEKNLVIEKAASNNIIINNNNLNKNNNFDNHKFYDSTGKNDNYEYKYEKYEDVMAEDKNNEMENLNKNNENINNIKILPSTKIKEDNSEELTPKSQFFYKAKNFSNNNIQNNIQENFDNMKELSVNSEKIDDHVKEIKFYETQCNDNRINKLTKKKNNVRDDIISKNLEEEELTNENECEVYNTESSFFKKSKDKKFDMLQNNNIIYKSDHAQKMLDSLLQNMQKQKNKLYNGTNINKRLYSADAKRYYTNNINLIDEKNQKNRVKLFDEEKFKNILKKNKGENNYKFTPLTNFEDRSNTGRNILDDKLNFRTWNIREKRDKQVFMRNIKPYIGSKILLANLRNKIMPPNDIY